MSEPLNPAQQRERDVRMYGTDMGARPRIPCRICGDPTPMLGTRLCDRCWELEGRIKRDPELARKIVAKLGGDDDDAKCIDFLVTGIAAASIILQCGRTEPALSLLDKMLATEEARRERKESA